MFLIIGGTVIAYLFLRWILTIQFSLVQLNAELLESSIPFLFASIPLLIWLRPKLKILKFSYKPKEKQFNYLFIPWIMTSVLILISQEKLLHLTQTFGKVHYPEEVAIDPDHDYYSIEQYVILKSESKVLVGENLIEDDETNELSLYVYYAVPMLPDSFASKEVTPKVWFSMSCVQHDVDPSNTRTIEAIEQEFHRTCFDSIYNFDTHSFDLFKKIPESRRKKNLTIVIQREIDRNVEDLIFLEPAQPPKSKRSILPWIFWTLFSGTLIMSLFLLIPKLDKRELIRQRQGLPPSKPETVLPNIFNPFGKRPITSTILISTLVVYALMWLDGVHPYSPLSLNLTEWGAFNTRKVLEGEYWRFLTGLFVHEDLNTLIYSSIGIAIIGIFHEKSLGVMNYLLIYSLGGFISLVTILFLGSSTVASGAPGGVFALVSAMLIAHFFRDFPSLKNLYMIAIYGGVLVFYLGTKIIYGIYFNIYFVSIIFGTLYGLFLCIANPGKEWITLD